MEEKIRVVEESDAGVRFAGNIGKWSEDIQGQGGQDVTPARPQPPVGD